MKRVYEQHKSSVFDTDANIVSLSVYLIPLLGNFMTLGIISWVFPLVLLFVEKKSPLVYFHAVQSLVMQVVVTVFSIVSFIMTVISAGSSFLLGFNVFGAIGAAGIFSLISLVINGIMIAFEVVGIIKAYGWEAYYLPLFGTIVQKFTKE